MLTQILSLTKKLILIPSTKDNPKALNQTLEIAKRRVKGYTIEEFEKNKIKSLLVYKERSRAKKFKIILNAHLDVVSAKKEQFKPYEKEGKLYGRGSYDMKTTAAVEILVFQELAKTLPYPIALQLVTDEEVGGFNGTKYQIKKGVRADFVIAGEPTDFGINHLAKGIIWANIKIKGKTAHGAYIWQGENAIWKAYEILNSLSKIYPQAKKEIWGTTVNLAKIETSNLTFNKVPDEAKISLDVRFIPKDKKQVIENLKKICDRKGKLEIILNEPPQETDKNNFYLISLRNAVKKITGKNALLVVKHGGSDIRHFNQVGCSGVTFGPVGSGLHTDNEWVDIKSLELYYKILKSFLLYQTA